MPHLVCIIFNEKLHLKKWGFTIIIVWKWFHMDEHEWTNLGIWGVWGARCFYFFRFELKYFDNFLALDEFSSGLIYFPLFFEWYAVACACFCLFLWLPKVLVSWTFAVSTPDHPYRGLFLALSLSILSFPRENFTLLNGRPELGWFSFLYFSLVFLFWFWDSYIHVLIPLLLLELLSTKSYSIAEKVTSWRGHISCKKAYGRRWKAQDLYII